MNDPIISVTKSYLPDLDKYISYLNSIWETNQLTNNGPYVRQLEEELKNFLNVKHLFFLANGTIALQIAIKSLGMQGEIITTPYSYVATTSTIIWEGCQPVFVDIDPDTLCIDPNLIENAITPKTIAILPTHVYGFPCDIKKIKKIADKHNLKIIYDAAHTFGVNYQGKSLVSFGDLSILSFHATKIFHTVEGGALVTNNDELAHRISYMRNFGHKGQEEYWGLGINGKNSEFHAAMGLCILADIPKIISARKKISELYRSLLSGKDLNLPTIPESTQYNYAYFPVLFKDEHSLLNALKRMKVFNIFPRRYFYPSLSDLPYIKNQPMLISEDIAKRVLCLPLYYDLPIEKVKLIAKLMTQSLGY